MEEYAVSLFYFEKQDISETLLDEIIKVNVPSTLIKEWLPEKTLKKSREIILDIENDEINDDEKQFLILASTKMKTMEILKSKYFSYVKQHPEKYGEVDRDKFAAQVELYFSEKISQHIREVRLDTLAEQIVEKINPSESGGSKDAMTLELLSGTLLVRCLDRLIQSGKVYDLRQFRGEFFALPDLEELSDKIAAMIKPTTQQSK